LGTRHELKAELYLDAGDYTAGMDDARASNDKFEASCQSVHDQTLQNIEVLKQAKDALGDMDSSVKGVTGALDHFGWASEDSRNKLNNMGEMCAMMEGFMKPFVLYLILAQGEMAHLGAAIMATSTAAMALGAMISLSSAKGKKEKAFWAGMVTTMWALTAAQTAYAIAKSGAVSLGTMSAATAAMIVGAITAAGVGIAATAATFSAQSSPGSPTGVEFHPGEKVTVVASRPGSAAGGSGRDLRLILLYRSQAQIATYLQEALDADEYRSGF